MKTLNKETRKEFDTAIIKAINDEYGVEVWDEKYTEFEVGTDTEADLAYDDAMDNLFEDVAMIDVPENMQFYIDKEAWMRDARINTWRGQELNCYDGKELEADVNGETFYIFRTN